MRDVKSLNTLNAGRFAHLAMGPQLAESVALRRSPQRERLLAASARASRVLLEASDVMAVMPDVLRELGEAAGVDRTALAVVERDVTGARWLLVKSEWIADVVADRRTKVERMAWDELPVDRVCSQLRSGHTVHVRHGDEDPHRESIALCGAKVSVIVPFLIDGVYDGAIGFDACRKTRRFEPDVVSALEIAASLVGAALQRDRLAQTVRTERERAAAQRVAQLAKANAALRSNLEWLAGASDPSGLYGHMLLETVRQFDAAAGTLLSISQSDEDWSVNAHVRGGVIADAPFARDAGHANHAFAALKHPSRQAAHWSLEHLSALEWPGMQQYHQREGHRGIYVLPLVFGERNVGVLMLAFAHPEPLHLEHEQLLVALGQQITLAIVFKRLAMSTRNVAVLAERNRIGQEIHDGLAQAFVGILMQLGAAEGRAEAATLTPVLTRIRDLAREGLSEARRSVLALSPAEPRAGGLERALRQLAERSTVPGGVTCAFEGGGASTGLAPEHEHELLRIAQEAISNAVRHGRPRNIRIALVVEAQALQFSVSDDGCGMHETPEHYAQHGFGLTNMRERAQAIGGQWQIASQPGRGTRIQVRVARPIPP